MYAFLSPDSGYFGASALDESFRQRRNRRHELGGVDRLREMHLESGPQRLHPILGSRVGRQCGCRNLSDAVVRVTTHSLNKRKPIQLWHPEVRHHDIRRLDVEHAQRVQR
jgi:hypothetical protein